MNADDNADVKTFTKLQYFREQYDDGIITKEMLQAYISQIMMSGGFAGKWLTGWVAQGSVACLIHDHETFTHTNMSRSTK